MALEIHDANHFGPLTGERLRRLEAQLKARLPDNYRAFLLRYNGGRPTRPRFTYTADGEEQASVQEWFFAVHDQPNEEPDDWTPAGWTPAAGPPPHFAQPLEEVWADLRSEKSKSEKSKVGMLPIARDPAGSLIGLGHTGKRAGAVWLYDHDTESFVRLADSFAAFLASLTRLPPGDWVPWLIVE
jgi:hypothetical protein